MNLRTPEGFAKTLVRSRTHWSVRGVRELTSESGNSLISQTLCTYVILLLCSVSEFSWVSTTESKYARNYRFHYVLLQATQQNCSPGQTCFDRNSIAKVSWMFHHIRTACPIHFQVRGMILERFHLRDVRCRKIGMVSLLWTRNDRYCRVIDHIWDDSIWNHLYSESADLLNIYKRCEDNVSFFVVISSFIPPPKKNALLPGQWFGSGTDDVWMQF